MRSMDKYGIMPFSEQCPKCHGDGEIDGIICDVCGGTGRKSSKVDPVKEAEELKKEIKKQGEN